MKFSIYLNRRVFIMAWPIIMLYISPLRVPLGMISKILNLRQNYLLIFSSPLTLCMPGEISADRFVEIFFLFSPENSFQHIVQVEDSLLKMSNPVFWGK